MINFKNLSFFKIVAVSLSVCLFADTIAYAVPTLRANSMFDEINQQKDTERVSAIGSTEVITSQSMLEFSQGVSPSISIDRLIDFYKQAQSIKDSPVIKRHGYQTNIYIFEDWNLVVKVPMSIVSTIRYLFLNVLTLFNNENEDKHERRETTNRNIGLIIKEIILTAAVVLLNIGVSPKSSPYIAHSRLGGLVASFDLANETIWQQKVTSYSERLEQLCREGRIEEAKIFIRRLVELNCNIWERGVFVKDIVYKNVGINDNEGVVLIDVGRMQDVKPSAWKIKLYLAFMKVKERSFLSKFDRRLLLYYDELTSQLWTIENIDRLWGKKEGRSASFIMDARLTKFFTSHLRSLTEENEPPSIHIDAKHRDSRKKVLWNYFEQWFFKDIEKSYTEGRLSEEHYKRMIGVRESDAMKAYAQTYLMQASPKIIIWVVRFVLVTVFGLTGTLGLFTGYLSFWFPSIILRVVPIIYFWWKNPQVNFGLALTLGIIFPPGTGFLIIPLQVIFTFKNIFYFKIKTLILSLFPEDVLYVPKSFIEQTESTLSDETMTGQPTGESEIIDPSVNVPRTDM